MNAISSSFLFKTKFGLLIVAFFLVIFFSSVAKADNTNSKNSYEFALTSDTGVEVSLGGGGPPFTNSLEQNFLSMMQQLNAEKDLSFVAYVGDFQGLQGCSDAKYQEVLGQFNSSDHPFIFIPGDTEWTDCGLIFKFNPRDPLDALAKLRELFFLKKSAVTMSASQGESLGQKNISLTQQNRFGDDSSTSFDESKFVENQMWKQKNVLFITLHIVGANDNCVMRNANQTTLGNTTNVPVSCSSEKQEREAANIAWLHQAFVKAQAEDAKGVVVLFHANMSMLQNQADGSCYAVGTTRPDGILVTNALFQSCKIYENYRKAIYTEAVNFGKPVALLSGDEEFYWITHPYLNAPNVVGVQNTGSGNTGWVRVTVDPHSSNLFSFSKGGCIPLSPDPVCSLAVTLNVLSPQTVARQFGGLEGSRFATNTQRLWYKQIATLPGGNLNGEIVYVGNGCQNSPYLANPAGRIALVDRGVCNLDDKVARAQKAQAIGVIIINTTGGDIPFKMTGNSPVINGGVDVYGTVITIPAISITRTSGFMLRDAAIAYQNDPLNNLPVMVNIVPTDFLVNP